MPQRNTDLSPAPSAKPRLTGGWPRPLTVLGIETSCDETGIGIVRLLPASPGLPQAEVLGEALHSQIDLHAAYGGVVPELASRDHVIRILPLIGKTLSDSKLCWDEIDCIAYTQGPGLAGALLVGASVAQGLAQSLDKPVMGVHHLEGHLLSPLIGKPESLKQKNLSFPFLALLVSGGHTQLMRVNAIGSYELLGETIDDAAGEAFDKSAQLLGLGYPGGPAISKCAEKGNAKAFDFPRPLLKRDTLDFSFAGLKTAVLTQVRKLETKGAITEQEKADVAASVQAAIVDVLIAKCAKAIAKTSINDLVIAGGVSANQLLRQKLAGLAASQGARIHLPPASLCTDNGVMIAWAAALRIYDGFEANQPGAFDVKPRWPLSSLGA